LSPTTRGRGLLEDLTVGSAGGAPYPEPGFLCSGLSVPYTLRLQIEKHDRSRYEWHLAGVGGVIARGAEPDITFCLAASALGLVPDAPVSIEYGGVHAGIYTASRLHTEPAAVTNDIMEAIAASKR
jgi:hypothetical protein